MKRRPCYCPKPILWELNSFRMQTLSFVPINLHICWARKWKHSLYRCKGYASEIAARPWSWSECQDRFFVTISAIIVRELCSNTAVNVTSYYLLFALQGNETTNGGANNHLCANNIQIPAGSSKTYSCSPKAYGRYLYIRLPNMWLTLCEVEVYSYLKTESKSTFLSSCLFCRYMHDAFLPFTKQVICFKNRFVLFTYKKFLYFFNQSVHFSFVVFA